MSNTELDKYRYILMKDAIGEEAKASLTKKYFGIGTEKQEPVNVLRGELIIPLQPQRRDDGKPPHNYCLRKNLDVTFYTPEDEVSPLDHADFNLLQAIETPHDRWHVFAKANKLEWGAKLKVDDDVYVRLPGPASNPVNAEWCRARIGYKGYVQNLNGTNFGVGIIDPKYRGRGYTNGFFQGNNYFKCEEECGLFVSLDRLSPHPPQGSAQVTPQANQSVDNTWKRSSAEITDPNLGSSVDIPKPDKPIELNDRVVVFNKKGIAIHGVIRWIGKKTRTRTLEVPYVGIETDATVYASEVNEALVGMGYLTYADLNRSLVVPLAMVVREDLSAKTRSNDDEQHKGRCDTHKQTVLAKELGMSKRELKSAMKQQEQVLKEAEKKKQAEAKAKHSESFEEVKNAMGESITLAEQQRILDKIQRGKDNQGAAQGVQHHDPSHTIRPEGNQHLLKQHSWQHPGHLYEPIPGGQGPPGGSPNTRRRLLEQGKSASVTEGRGAHQHYQGHADHSGIPGNMGSSGQRQWEDHAKLHQDVPNQYHPEIQQRQAYLNPVGSQVQYKAHTDLPSNTDLPVAIKMGFEVGSTIQIQSTDPIQPQRYGVIRWIGELRDVQGQVAGIELEDFMEGCSDGTWQQTGQRFFECEHGKGIYYPVHNLKRDERFCVPGDVSTITAGENPLKDVSPWEDIDQNLEPHPLQMKRYVGDEKGIQGHQNSCYLDATVFGLFALSDVFDSMFLDAHKTADQSRKEIEALLWKGIVNPLRKNGVVRYESVMKLRSKLDELGKMEGIAQDEKDPEEFLNMLFKHMLRVEPFIEIKRPFGIEKEYFVQLFLEYDETLRLPTVGDLLRKMFKEQKISFTEMPSRLLIQVPRFGKQFKTYQKIVPDLKLRIMDLTDTYVNAQIPDCFICGERAMVKCMGCTSDFKTREPSGEICFCEACDKQVHSKKARAMHPPRELVYVGDGGVSELDLLSVICIETSHYVCFAKDPHEEHNQPPNWIFFDSMASRVFDTYNLPKVTECTADLNEWVYPANGDRTRLMSTPPKNLPEYVRRFTQDVYMCVYVHPDLSLYG